MRGVAARLGVGTMSLYWHVRNKEELLWLVVDELLADVPLPGEGPDPFADIAEIARGLRAVLLRHRRAVPVLVGRPGFGPNGLVFGERLLAAIHSAGFSGDTAADAYAMCVNYTTGFVLYEVLTSDITWTGSSTAESLRHDLATYLAGLPAATFPNLRSGGQRLIWSGGDASFDFGMNSLLDGLKLSRLRSREGEPRTSLPRRPPSGGL
jgi:AcrR family transcriptional regulator